MKIIEIVSLIILACLCVITTNSDLKKGMIYNRTLIKFSIVAILLDSIYYGVFATDLFGVFIFNLIVVVCVSSFLFFTHSFAGGDCKLAIVLTMLLPAKFYLIYGSTTVTVFFTIGLAIIYGYLYLLISSLLGILRGKRKISVSYITQYIFSFIKSFLTALVYISMLNLVILFAYKFQIRIFDWLIRIVCIVTAWAVGRFSIFRNKCVLSIAIILDIVLTIYLRQIPFSINPENYILVVILLICQMTITTSIYDNIPIGELKEGMILSTGMSVLMQGSRVRGLPGISVEDLRNRLSKEEIESIGRWGKSNGIEEITIVRKIPFAIFLFMGYATYLIAWSVLS